MNLIRSFWPDIKLAFKEFDEDFGWSEKFPEWILAGIALVAILVLLFDPFNAL